MNLWKEAEWSEMLFSYLTTGWYDWTVSEHLYKNNTHCWSVTSGYYSHYILAAALLKLYQTDDSRSDEKRKLRRISESHAALSQFLQGNIEPDLRITFLQYLHQVSGENLKSLEENLKQFGEALYQAKKARESHTYHVLVVSHQTLADVTSRRGFTEGNSINVGKTVEKINGYILELSAIINTFVVDLVLRVLTNMDESVKHVHLKHFKEEIDDFFLLVEKENILPIPQDLLESLKLAERTIENELDERKCVNYRRFKETLSSFAEKWDSYRQLEKNLWQMETTIQQLKSETNDI